MEALHDVIHAIYETALLPERWPATLRKVGSVFRAEGAAIVFYTGNERTDLIYSSELHDSVESYVGEGWWKQDILAQRVLAKQIKHGDVVDDFMLATQDEIDNHPIYVEFFRRFGLGWIMGCSILPDLDMLVSVSVPRAMAKGPYEPAEMALLRELGRHIEQALRISLRITNLEASETALLSAIDTVAAAIYGLNGRGQLVLTNRHGRDRFDDCFCTVDGCMTPRLAGERRRFGELVAAAGQPDLARSPPRPCMVTGQDGRRVAAWALPVTESARWRLGSHNEVGILVLAVPVERGKVVDPAVIRDLFGLTLGEARLAALIGGGMAVGNAADRLGVTQGTARVVLKQVFRKLGVNRQAELALQLSNLAGFAVGKVAAA